MPERIIPYGRQWIDDTDVDAVVAVLRSDWLTQGPAIPRFESELAARCGAAQAVAVCNATAALHVSCLALGVGPGDRVWTSPNTFVASANAARLCGAEIDFVDIDPRSYNMCVESLAAKLRDGESTGRLPKVVVPVHFAGQACDMRGISALADDYGFAVLEDAAHALGGEYAGDPIGSCRYADIAILSFHPVKIVTTGEGGAALTNDLEIAERLRLLRSHGITRDATCFQRPSDGPWYYEQTALGLNYRLTDIQAALGSSQLARLPEFIARRRAIAARYDRELASLQLVRPWQHADGVSAYHLYPVRIPGKPGRRQVFDALRASGVGVNVHYIPVHTQPYYQAMGFISGDFPVAESFYEEAISLPIYPALSDEEQSHVIGALRRALE